MFRGTATLQGSKFLETHVQGLKEDDQMYFFERLKCLSVEDIRNVSSQHIRDEEGRVMKDQGLKRQKKNRPPSLLLLMRRSMLVDTLLCEKQGVISSPTFFAGLIEIFGLRRRVQPSHKPAY